MKKKREAASLDSIEEPVVHAVAAARLGPARVRARPVTDASVLDQARVYSEAVRQTGPLAEVGTPDATQIADMICDGTARRRGVSKVAANRMATSSRPLSSFTEGANPIGKAAEVVTTLDYLSLHNGDGAGIVNPPKYVASNVHDIRLAPDSASRKDLVFAFHSKSGKVIWKYNGQVKTGGGRYVTDTLVAMANKPGYGKIGYVDARYVDADGGPRVGRGAFTKKQAERLRAANVRLRGIENLEARADQLMQNIKAGEVDGLDPLARQELEHLREDIRAAYKRRELVARMGGAAAAGAATAAVVALCIQLATDGKIDVVSASKAAGSGAAFGAGATLADAALYHLGHNVFDLAPEVAKELAGKVLSAGFCLFSVGVDLASEANSARRGEVTVEDAAAGASMKIALNLLPLIMGPLGLPGMAVLIGAQVGGRILISKMRKVDRTHKVQVQSSLARADALIESAKSVSSSCDETDTLFDALMKKQPPGPCRRLVAV